MMSSNQWALVNWAFARGRLTEYEQWKAERMLAPGAAPSELDRRAAYLSEVVHALNSLGLHNIHEPETLFIEPLHAYSPLETAAAFAAIHPALGAKQLSEMSLGVLSPGLVAGYMMSQATATGMGSSCASLLSKMVGANDPVLCDPLYGVAMIRDGAGWRQMGFANALWQELALALPHKLAMQHLENPVLALRQGVFISRDIFGDALPVEAQKATRDLRVPEIPVSSADELQRWMDKLQAQITRAGMVLRLWYRGQSVEHSVPDRTRLVSDGIAPYCAFRDSSLVPSLYRKIDNQTATPTGFMKLVRHIGDWTHSAQMLLPDVATILDASGRGPYRPRAVPQDAAVRASMYMAGRPHANQPGLRDLGPYTRMEVLDGNGAVIEEYLKIYHPSVQGARVMLLLQHYGCPTAWIDVTHDRDTALWFALHKLDLIAPGEYRATPVRAAPGSAPSSWPVIYVFALHDEKHPIIDTSKMLAGSDFLRPQVQKCGLLGGAGNLARNYQARYVALKFRLAPGFATEKMRSVVDMFPPPSQDSGFRKLIEADQRAMNDQLYRVYSVTGAA